MRLYLKNFRMLTREQEENYLFHDRRTLLTSKYPFNVFRYRELPTFAFGSVTIFCGSNGSGKLMGMIKEVIYVL